MREILLHVLLKDHWHFIAADIAAGIGVLNTGHCHPHVVKAIQAQAATLMHLAGTDYYYDIQTRLAERLGSKVRCRVQEFAGV